MEDILFDDSLLFETEVSVAINEIESYSFDGQNFDYAVTGGSGSCNGDITSETIITIPKRYTERINNLSIYTP